MIFYILPHFRNSTSYAVPKLKRYCNKIYYILVVQKVSDPSVLNNTIREKNYLDKSCSVSRSNDDLECQVQVQLQNRISNETPYFSPKWKERKTLCVNLFLTLTCTMAVRRSSGTKYWTVMIEYDFLFQ